MYFVIKVGSVTNAQRGLRILHSLGYKATMSRLQNPVPGEGCGYVINVRADDDEPVYALKSNGIDIIGVETK